VKAVDVINRYRESYKNWLYVMRHMRAGTENIMCILKNGEKIELNREIAAYLSHILMFHEISAEKIEEMLSTGILEFVYNQRTLKMKIYEKSQISGDIGPIFWGSEYSFLTGEDAVILDIGANIGDSVIYFSLNGAREVIAIEPYPYSFEIAKFNVAVNNLNGKIHLYNLGYGRNRKMRLDNRVTTAGNDLVEADKGEYVEIMSLESLLKEFLREDVKQFHLKMDCEGCEYALLDEKRDVFDKLDKIQLEYHYGLRGLDKFLKGLGFNVKFTKPVDSYNPYASEPHMQVGYLYAERTPQKQN
jgi:FkbM family methyltransferase